MASYSLSSFTPVTGSSEIFTFVAIDGSTAIACNSNGIWQSSDSGVSWTLVLDGIPLGVSFVSIDINGSNAITSANNGIWYSSDSGVSWTLALNGVPLSISFSYVAIDGANAIALTSTQIWYSSNSGSSWTFAFDGPAAGVTTFNCVAISGTNAIAGSNNGLLFYSNNGGSSWTNVLTLSPTTNIRTAIIGGLNAIIGTNSGLLYSSTGGANGWSTMGATAGVLFTSLSIDGTNAIAGSIGGAWYSSNGGSSWTASSGTEGLTITYVNINGAVAVASCFPNGLYLSTNFGVVWNIVSSTALLRLLQVVLNIDNLSVAVAGRIGETAGTTPGAYYTPTALCLNHDTKILCLTAEGDKYVPIQDLREGHFVKSYLHGYRKIQCIGKNTMINKPTLWMQSMWKMEKTDTNGLIEDLITLGGHSLLVDTLSDEIVCKYKEHNWYDGTSPTIDNKLLLCAGLSGQFIQLTDTDIYTYYQLTLDNDGDKNKRFGIWANGVLVETPSETQYNWIKWCPME